MLYYQLYPVDYNTTIDFECNHWQIYYSLEIQAKHYKEKKSQLNSLEKSPQAKHNKLSDISNNNMQ